MMNPDVPGKGFTVIELVVALAIGGIVLLGARTLYESVVTSVDHLRARAMTATIRANGDRLLHSLVAGAHDQFGGDERVARFTGWCIVPAGWQERCRIQLEIDTLSAHEGALIVRLSTGEVIALRRGFQSGTLRYIGGSRDRGQWFRVWGEGIAVPLAIGFITDGDTSIVRIGESP